MKFNHAILFLGISCLPACTWVQPTTESKQVTLVKAFNVNACEKLGTTTATVTHKVGIITRGEDTVTEELVTVAKNRAAEMGGDSIVSKGPANEGVMSFDIYKCGE